MILLCVCLFHSLVPALSFLTVPNLVFFFLFPVMEKVFHSELGLVMKLSDIMLTKPLTPRCESGWEKQFYLWSVQRSPPSERQHNNTWMQTQRLRMPAIPHTQLVTHRNAHTHTCEHTLMHTHTSIKINAQYESYFLQKSFSNNWPLLSLQFL